MADKYKHELPPPNIYDPDFKKVSQKAPATGFGYGERSSLSKTFIAPGPGAYKSPTAIGEGPRYHLGVKLFDSYEAKRMKDLPAPNIYNPKFDVMAKTTTLKIFISHLLNIIFLLKSKSKYFKENCHSILMPFL